MSTNSSSRRRKTPQQPVEMEVTLGTWGTRGSVRAEAEGKMVSVDRGIPGEKVLAAIDVGRKPYRGVVVDVREASALRVTPPCQYFLGNCGGCQWQHLNYEAQVGTKRDLVNRELEEAGCTIRVGEVHPMESPWRYRRTASLALGWEAGFRPRARRGILEIHDCPISHPLIGQFSHQLNEVLRSGSLPNYHGKVWLDCTVVGSDVTPALQVVIQGITGLTLDSHPELPEAAQTLARLEGVESVAFRHRSGEPRALVGDLFSWIEVQGRLMALPAGSFFQTNLGMVGQVLDAMRILIDAHDIATVADIYGGVGTFGLPLAQHVRDVTIVELDPLAVEAAGRTARQWGITNVQLIARHAERALPELPALDLALVDPPRSGLGATVIDALTANGVPRIFYVSCAPPSLARDLRTFEVQGYTVRSLDIYDFYPQTYHVESLAVLERR